MKQYALFVKIDGEWQSVKTLEADSHREAFRQSMLALHPKHYDKPIKLEQVVHDIGQDQPKSANLFFY